MTQEQVLDREHQIENTEQTVLILSSSSISWFEHNTKKI